MKSKKSLVWMLLIFILTALACRTFTPSAAPTPTSPPLPTRTPTSLPRIPVEPGSQNPDEPVFISGAIPYSSPFFLNTISEPFVLLEDQAGFVRRDKEFRFNLEGQAIGPVEVGEDLEITYSLALPSVPQGSYLDLDNDGEEETGVQVFAVAYWSNTWGGPFLEERDGSGWSTAYASTRTDPERDDEIEAGILIVWSPDDEQAFPSGFGEDGLLFTGDDPSAPIPAGYNVVDLNQEPFSVYKSARVEITLNEGEIAVNDYSELEYEEAFRRMAEKAAREYPFTVEKQVDWEPLIEEFAGRAAQTNDDDDFYKVLRDFTQRIPDGHVGVSFNAQVFYEERGGGFGLVLAELSDGRVIATQVLPDMPADNAGIRAGAEIIEWDGKAVSEAISESTAAFGPYSTEHTRRLGQVAFLTRTSEGSRVQVRYQNPDAGQADTATLTARGEYDSLFASIAAFQQDELELPIEANVLEDSGLGYLRITTFSDDYALMAKLWDRYLASLIDNEIPGLIIDVRNNGGGSGSLSLDFAGYFFEEEITLYDGFYFNENSQAFETDGYPSQIKPGPRYYDGPVALLVSPDCVSACEGFTYAMTQQDRSLVVGHYATAGAFGEVGRGQYKLPGDYSVQFPTGRPQTAEGALLIEGQGVSPDISVPVTFDSAMGKLDAVLQAAVEALVDQISP